MEKFEIMKSIFAVTQSMPTKSTNRTRLLNLIDELYEADDVVFKKESYSPHNLKHKHLTNKEGFSQLLYRKDETIMRAQVC